MTDKWCKWAGIAAAIFLLAAPGVRASVPLAQDLREAGRQAEQRCVPLLLEFASEHCEYCTLLEREILNPTLLDQDYEQRVLMRKLLVGNATRLRDFDNQATDADSLAGRYRIWVTPTVLFLDSNGEEIAERLVGVSSLDFYGGYLDAALNQARKRLQELGRCDGTDTQELESAALTNVSPYFR